MGAVALLSSPPPASRLREIKNPLTWVYCFLSFIAAKTDFSATRELVAYAQIVVQLARKHGGVGWLAYDQHFRQQLAGGSGAMWNDINNSLMSATVLAPSSDDLQKRTICSMCRGDDHSASECALRAIQPYLFVSHSNISRTPALIGTAALKDSILTKDGKPCAATITRVIASWKKQVASLNTPASCVVDLVMGRRTARTCRAPKAKERPHQGARLTKRVPEKYTHLSSSCSTGWTALLCSMTIQIYPAVMPLMGWVHGSLHLVNCNLSPLILCNRVIML